MDHLSKLHGTRQVKIEVSDEERTRPRKKKNKIHEDKSEGEQRIVAKSGRDGKRTRSWQFGRYVSAFYDYGIVTRRSRK